MQSFANRNPASPGQDIGEDAETNEATGLVRQGLYCTSARDR